MIYQKLLEFQKLNIKIERDAQNPHFKSRYSSLNEVLDKVKKPLNDVGIVIVQHPTTDGLNTTLYDTEDDTMVHAFVPFVNATDMQKLGGAITYARRYSLITLLGLEDEDDDGNTASTPQRPAQRRTEAPKGVVAREDAPDLDIDWGTPTAGDYALNS